MRTVVLTRSEISSACGLVIAWDRRNFSSVWCVRRKPTEYKLIRSNAKSAAARRKAPCSRRPSFLNRWRRSRITRTDMKKAVGHKALKEILQIHAEQARFHLILRQQLLVDGIDGRQACQKLPHPRACLVQTEIALGLEVQEDRFPVEKAHQNVRRNRNAI